MLIQKGTSCCVLFEADDESWTVVGVSDAALFGEPMQLNCATQRARDGIQTSKLWATQKPDIKKQEPQKADQQSAEF